MYTMDCYPTDSSCASRCFMQYILRGAKLCKKQYVTVADRLISIHKAASCFRITLFFIPPAHHLLCTCFKPALGVRVAMFHVLGLVGCSSAASLLLTSTGRCANLVFLQPPCVWCGPSGSWSLWSQLYAHCEQIFGKNSLTKNLLWMYQKKIKKKKRRRKTSQHRWIGQTNHLVVNQFFNFLTFGACLQDTLVLRNWSFGLHQCSPFQLVLINLSALKLCIFKSQVSSQSIN